MSRPDQISISSSVQDEEEFIPRQFEATDAQSEISPINSRFSGVGSERNLRITRTETTKSLQDLGISSDVPIGDVNAPPVEAAIFPEEYTLETSTGLVPVQTLQELGRIKSNIARKELSRPRTSSVASGESLNEYDEESSSTDETKVHGTNLKKIATKFDNFDPDIEFVTFLINDPANPHNWSMTWKWLYTIILSIFVISAAYGSSCLATGLPTVNAKFGVSTEVSTLTVSLMVLGFSIGPLIWAPLSEQIGRRPVYFISFGLYVLFNVPCAVAKNIGTLLVCRFLCGVFASSALTNVGASLVDIHNETRSLAIAFFSFAPYSGPVLGGIVNGFVSVSTHRFDLIIWVNMAFAGVMWLIVASIPETYAPVILKRRAQKLRKETGNDKIMTEQEATPLSIMELINDCLIRPLKFIVQEPVLDLVCAFVALIYAMLYAFFFAYPVIFNELYGFEDNKIGLMFIPILIGAGLALTTTPILEKRYMAMTKRRTPVPEDRLIGAMIGSPFPCIALFILGATSYKHIIWVGPASSGIAFGYGMVLIYYSLNNYIIDTYAKYAASALATKVFLRSAGGAAFPLFITQMYHRLGLQWASWLLAFICLAMILIPYTFYMFGKGLRAKLCKEDYSAVHY
ncbi:multidrug resistance protein 3 [Scheffersomyces amazonensis]|uniref:multidrug resistance protein 3 n=1 Tax=Scheffersomyces amazonensis TaxID=1078765 RepID=UPI00315C9619